MSALPADKKTVYHSHMVRHTNDCGGSVWVQLVGRQGSVVKGQGYTTVPMLIAEDGFGERNHKPEHAGIEHFFEGLPTNEWLALGWEGTADAAVVALFDQNGAVVRSSSGSAAAPAPPRQAAPAGPPAPPRQAAPAGPPPPPAQASPPNGNGHAPGAPPPASPHADREPLMGDMWRCLEAAWGLTELFFEKHQREPSEQERMDARTLFIELQRSFGARTVGSPPKTVPAEGYLRWPTKPTEQSEPPQDRNRALQEAAANGTDLPPAPAGAPAGGQPDRDDLPF